MKQYLSKFAMLGVVVLLLTACTSQESTPAPAVEETTMIEESGDGESLAMVADDTVDYTMELSAFKYEPNVIEGEAGQTLRIKLFSNDENMMHDFILEELNVASSQLKGGEEEIIEITIPEDASGKEYEFYCSVGAHRQQGQVGTLRVL